MPTQHSRPAILEATDQTRHVCTSPVSSALCSISLIRWAWLRFSQLATSATDWSTVPASDDGCVWSGI